MRKYRSAVGAAIVIIAALAFAVPAAALDVQWYVHDLNYFSGPGCGATSQLTVAIRRNAFDVSIARPKVGTKLTDDTTGRTDGTITSIRRSVGRITFTATGSDDVCSHPDRYAENGWETNYLHFDVTYSTREHGVYPSSCNNPAYRPQRIVVACRRGNFYVDHIRWSSWTDTGARGVGTAHVSNCTSSCAMSQFRSYPGIVIQLKNLRYCAANSDFEFTRLEYRYSGKRPGGSPVAGSGRSGCAVIKP